MVAGGSLGSSLQVAQTRFDSFQPLFFSVSATLSSLQVVLGFLLLQSRLMRNSERLGFPTFAALGKGIPVLREFSFEVGEWLPLLPVFELPWLTGQLLAEVVRR